MADERLLEIRGHEAERLLKTEAFRTALEHTFAWTEQGLEQAEDEHTAWLALQRRRATREVLAFLVISIKQGNAIATKEARLKRFAKEQRSGDEDMAAWLRRAGEAREKWDEEHSS